MSGDQRKSPRELRAEVDEELAYHLERRAGELEQQGYKPDEARAEALRRFGDLGATSAACVESDRRRQRTALRRAFFRDLGTDLRFAVRRVRRRPLIAVVIAATLGLGIGAVTAMFSVADHVLLRPLPISEENRVVTVWERGAHDARRRVAPGNFIFWRDHATAFSAMGLAEPAGYDLTSADERPESLSAWRVSEGFFPALGAHPELGRLPRPDEFRPGATRVAVLAHDFWLRRFGGDPAVVGSNLQLNDRSFTVVGILPRNLEYPRRAVDVWTPKAFEPEEVLDHESSYTQVVARLVPGASFDDAQRDLDRVSSLLTPELPPGTEPIAAVAQPLRQHLFGDVRPALLVLLGAVAFVLAAGCASVASLLLAEATRREREMAVRAAVGAGRGRLVQQLLTEGLVYAVLGGLAGLGVASLGIHAIVTLGPAQLPRLATVALDGRALVFAGGLAVVTVLLFALTPALGAAREDVAAVLRDGHRPVTARSRLRRLLVSLEVAFALVLLVGTGLLGRSFARLRDNELGFRADGLAELQLFLYHNNPSTERRHARTTELTAALAAVPGVTDVAAVSALPFHPHTLDANYELTIEGSSAPHRRVNTTIASPGYFHALGIPLVSGRGFDEARDGPSAERVAVVNQALARSLFPGVDPIGQRVRVAAMGDPEVRTIVGIVGDVRATSLASEPRPEVFVPVMQADSRGLIFVVRVGGSAEAAARALPALRDAVWRVDPAQSIFHSGVVDDLVAGTLSERRFNLFITTGLSMLALVLAAAGVATLVSYETRLRTHELGVRMALGARPHQVIAGAMWDGLVAVLPGLVVGLGAAAAVARGLGGMLYHVDALDPATFVVIGLGTLAVAALAAFLPARRAAAVDPLEAMRG